MTLRVGDLVRIKRHNPYEGFYGGMYTHIYEDQGVILGKQKIVLGEFANILWQKRWQIMSVNIVHLEKITLNNDSFK